MAAAFAYPPACPSSATARPGPAALWEPPRPFPALRWLVEQRPALAARLTAGLAPRAAASPAWGGAGRSAAVPGGSSPHREAAQRPDQPAQRPAVQAEAGAPGPARHQRVVGEPPRLEMELRLLFSRSPRPPAEDFFLSLRAELGHRAWSLAHAIGAPRPAWSPAPGADSDLNKLRARLVTEVHLGLTMVEAAPIRFPRPVRNRLLARHARQIGQRLADLLRHPEAGALGEELSRLLDALHRQY